MGKGVSDRWWLKEVCHLTLRLDMSLSDIWQKVKLSLGNTDEALWTFRRGADRLQQGYDQRTFCKGKFEPDWEVWTHRDWDTNKGINVRPFRALPENIKLSYLGEFMMNEKQLRGHEFGWIWGSLQGLLNVREIWTSFYKPVWSLNFIDAIPP